MWGFLSNSYAPDTANDNFKTTIYFLGLVAYLVYLLRPVDAIYIILGIFDLVLYSEDPFYHSRDGIPLGALYDCREKETLFNCDVLRIS